MNKNPMLKYADQRPLFAQHAGFTLLELLVVLVIVGMAAAFAGPSLWKTYVKSNERSMVYAFADSLGVMRQNAFHQGKSVSLPALNEGSIMDHNKFPALPDGWVLERSTALRFLPSGVTNGASFYLNSPVGNRWRLSLEPLDGRVGVHRL